MKTGEGDILKKVRLCFLKSGGRKTPLCELAGREQGVAWKELEREGQFATKKSLWNCGRHMSARHRMVGQRGI